MRHYLPFSAVTLGLAMLGFSAPVQADSYIIIAKSNQVPRGLEKQVANAGGEITGRLDAVGLVFASSDNPHFASGINGVHAVVEDYSFKPVEQWAVEFDASAVPAGAGDTNPFMPLLWGMDAINAPGAWEAGSRGEGATVFVLDEGFDLDHPDLVFNTDLAASFACYDIVGYDEADEPIVETNWDNCEPADYLLDNPFSHGTHTSGTIGAEDNDIGVIGVAPDAEMVPVKVLSEQLGYGFSSWIMTGIIYAADNGADVVNMSLGGVAFQGSGPDSSSVAAWRVAYNRAVTYAYNNGVTVVVSSGNYGADVRTAPSVLINPAMTTQALTIGATAPYGIAYDPDGYLDYLASYSTYGSGYVDFVAPGGDFQHPDALWYYDMVLSTGSQGAYYWSAGTSMAAPHAAGVAALIIAENGGDMHPKQVKRQIKKQATDLGSNGKDSLFGWGRVHTGY